MSMVSISQSCHDNSRILTFDIDSAIKALNTRPNLVGPDQTRSNCSGWPDIIVVNTGRPWTGPRLQFSGEVVKCCS